MSQGQFDAIPIIDVAPLFHGEGGLATVAQAVENAYSRVGFAYIINHRIPQELVTGVFAASADFHGLSQAEKMEIEINEFHRGFIPINTSTPRTSSVATVTKPNQSESFMMMHELSPCDPDLLAGADLAGPNQWPRQLPHFKAVVTAYNDAMIELARRLVEVMAVALGEAKDAFDPYFKNPTTFLRLLYYPKAPSNNPGDEFGSAPHTDYGFITILAQDENGGLQVRNVAGKWIDAPPLAGSFVMNVGDTLHRFSNGHFISTPHRVINRSGRPRYSCPFFFDPGMRAVVQPLPCSISRGRPSQYEPVVYGEYLMARLRANHDQHIRRASTCGMISPT